MAAAILLVGHELMTGKLRDGNGHWLAQRLHERGVPLDCIVTVDDAPTRISHALKDLIARRCDPILVSGGLGGTHDDTTLAGVAAAIDVPLVLDKTILNLVQAQWNRRASSGRPSRLSDAQVQTYLQRMATAPSGARGLPNGVGIAAGIEFQWAGSRIVCLPGVPSELQDIFIHVVEPRLGRGTAPITAEERCVARESELFPLLDAIVTAHPQVQVGSYPQSDGTVLVRFEGAAIAVERAHAQFVTDLPSADAPTQQ